MTPAFLGKFLIEGKVVLVTGLHIGGTTVGMEIGGIDNPVIKDPITDEPIIPGSSIKGKLRSLTEWSFGLIEKHPKHDGCQAYSCEILKVPETKLSPEQAVRWKNALIVARLYGPATDDKQVRSIAGPTRLIVRDAFLNTDSKAQLEKALGRGTYTEVKTENALDRVTSEANPRPVERVPAGSVFDLSLIVDKYDTDDSELLKHLFTAMSLLEQSSLGGGGSRGSGQIQFTDIEIRWRSTADYRQGNSGTKINLPEKTVPEILRAFDQINWPS